MVKNLIIKEFIMKKFIFVLFFTFSAVFIYGNGSENIPNYLYYSGKSIQNDSEIAVILGKKTYYVNIDKLHTNHDVYVVNELIKTIDAVIDSESESQNLETLLLFTAVNAKLSIKENNLNLEKLDDAFLESLKKKAAENEKILKNTPAENIRFINLDISENAVGNGQFMMIIGD
jgi:cell division protein ZapA (FtsZ GTPase activity inhibitor)